jgi:colanic acid/amylovoran biosynthesis glycosyltransferase
MTIPRITYRNMNALSPSGSLPRVVIFRSVLLPMSETFVREQAGALKRFEPVYAGLRWVSSGVPRSARNILLITPDTRFAVLRTLLYQFNGYSPAFKSRIEEAQPLLIHAHFALDGIAALPLEKHLGIPLIVSLHGYDVTTSDNSLRTSVSGLLYLLRRRELWTRVHTFLCVSEFIRSKAIEAGFPPNKLRVHYTGVNCENFIFSDQPRDESILFVGRLVQKKGCEFLLKAVAEVHRALPLTSLTIIGDGPLRRDLQAQASRLDVPVRFLGALPAIQIRDYMSRASIFCVPSLRADNGDSEGFGMVFAEAQAMGTPVVSFSHGGIPEAVEDGRTGLLVPERDTKALAAAMIRLLHDADLWHSFSVKGSERVRDHFSLEKQTRALEDIYLSVCAPRTRGK